MIDSSIQLNIDPAEWPDSTTQSRWLLEARKASAHARLCLQHRNWQGAIGNWSGVGVGSSIDFQDHRPYLPGDDPRYIDWAAYARSGHYIMKLYREEVSPRIDIILDVSRSMMQDEMKRRRVWELLYFCMESGIAMSASMRVFSICGNAWKAYAIDSLMAGTIAPPETLSAEPPEITLLPLQSGSLRVMISDLLFERSPAELVRSLVAGRGRASLLVPYLMAEEKPDWHGNVELIDCESGAHRRQRVSDSVLARYHDAYQRHVAAWRDSARRYDVRMARLKCEAPLSDSLREEAFVHGVVEAWT